MSDKKNKVKKIFDSIAFRYDLLNHLLSAGIDHYWRKKALKLTNFGDEVILLDVACGTGDVAIAARKIGIKNIFGADFSYNMLKLFNKKADWIGGRNVQMVAERIPLKDNSVTNITVAFGVRNFYNIEEGFKSFHRVLREKGKATVIEFQMPPNKLVAAFYKFYFTKILPVVGGVISGDKEAYKYLPDSVEEFDKKVDLVKIFKEAGFSEVKKYTLTLGIVQIVIAEK
jgi:demethylmenaquinone methyltransferase / 2-methoxy-6-polyprenyl-1,4-benzoquinol methylase